MLEGPIFEPFFLLLRGSKKSNLKQSIKIEFDFNFDLIAVVSNAKDYRLISKMNKVLHLEMVEIEDVEIIENGSVSAFYSRYSFFDEDLEVQYVVVSNKHENGYLVKECKEVDFFFLIEQPEQLSVMETAISCLNNISEVQMAFKMDVNKLKSRQNLIFE